MYGISYKNTVYEDLRCNIKFTKKSHPVWQSQQSMYYSKVNFNSKQQFPIREERNVNDVISTTDNEAMQGQPS